jgi:hypothetical protein
MSKQLQRSVQQELTNEPVQQQALQKQATGRGASGGLARASAHGNSAVQALLASGGGAPSDGGDTVAVGGLVMMKSSDDGGNTTDGVHQAAQAGVSGGAGKLPHLDKIQASFGGHDVSNVQAYTGSAATEATNAMGAEAYATGNQVAFGGGTPSVHTAAHEAAHVVQQKAGVSLAGGVGQAGDRYEQHADAVADAVVQGKSAEGLLDQMAGGQAQRTDAVQQKTSAQSSPVQFITEGEEEQPTPGTGTAYTADAYRSDCHDLLQYLTDNTRTAASQLKSALDTESFDVGNVVSMIATKGIGTALGYVPGAGPVLSAIWDVGTGVYAGAASAANSQAANTFFQSVMDGANQYQADQRGQIPTKASAYQSELDGLTGDAVQTRMDEARRINVRGIAQVPSAGQIEAGLWEIYLAGRTEGGGIEEFFGVETKGRIELTYSGTYAETPYTLESIKVIDSGNDGEAATRLNTVHENSANINDMLCPKRIKAPNNMWGGQSRMDFGPTNSVTDDNAMVKEFCWRQTMGSSFPSSARFS